MCNKTVCVISAERGAQFVLALCCHGFTFVPQNSAAIKILEDQNKILRQDLESHLPPTVFGLNFAKITGGLSQDAEIEHVTSCLAEIHVQEGK